MNCYFVIALAAFVTTSTCSRIKQINQHDLKTQGVKFVEGQTFICLQKWQKNGLSGYVDQFCLADLEEVMQGTTKGAKQLRAATSLDPCAAQSKPYTFKVCSIKGKIDKRLNYNDKVYAPKRCFKRLDTDFEASDGAKIPLLSAAVSASPCIQMRKLPESEQNKFWTQKPGSKKTTNLEPAKNIPAPVVAGDETTTTTTTVAEPEHNEVESIADEVIQRILDEDEGKGDGIGDLEIESDGAEDEVLDPQQVVQEHASATLDLDGIDFSEKLKLWRERDAANRKQD
jgi:hypothetical protein|mmetsp:Transcript_4114/g.6622  ORF Transcript_4114/g.6622 Transcript_4114/m.6622 type:complete len:285 (+) Transcript_4114:100-954(+)